MEDFDAKQQRKHLGGDVYDAIPNAARKILTIPRVLYYLVQVPWPRLAGIRTPSDVFHEAASRLVNDGIRGSRLVADLTASDARLNARGGSNRNRQDGGLTGDFRT